MPLAHSPDIDHDNRTYSEPGLLDLTSGVGNGQDNRPQDVFGFDSALRRADETYRPAAPYDRAPASLVHGSLVDGIERWQERKGLRTDGFALPGGETQHSLNNALLRKPAGAGLWRWETPLFKDIVGSGWANRYDDVRAAKRLFGATGWMKESPFDDPSPILDESLHDAIGAFQRRRGLKETHRIEPGDETDRALRADAAGLARQAAPAWRDFWRRHDASGLWTRGPGGDPGSGFALAKWDRPPGMPRDPLESFPGGPGMFGGATGGSMRRAPRPPAAASPPSRPGTVEEAFKSLGPTILPLGIAYETIRRILGQEDKPQTEVEQLIPDVPPEAGKPNVGPDPSRPPPPLATPGHPAAFPPVPRREEYPIREPKKGEGALVTPDEREKLRRWFPDWLESRHGDDGNREHIAEATGQILDIGQEIFPNAVSQSHGPSRGKIRGYEEKYYPPAARLPDEKNKSSKGGSFSDADGTIEYGGLRIRWVYNLYSPKTGSTEINQREEDQLDKFRRNAAKVKQLGIVINDWKRPKGSIVDFSKLQNEVRDVLKEIKRKIDNGELKPGDSFVREIWLNRK